LDPFGRFVIGGDFAGNGYWWELPSESHALTVIPSNKYCFPSSIRSIGVEPKGCWALVGLLDGSLFAWHPSNGESRTPLLLTVEGSITSIQFSSWDPFNRKRELVAIGSTSGKMTIVEIKVDAESIEAKVLCEGLAHAPGVASPQFGSLAKTAEIWSLIIGPHQSADAIQLATTSEDQTTKIWTVFGGKEGLEMKEERTLRGHTAAVTAVDWKATPLCSILATCADDQKVMLWRSNDWTLLKIFETSAHSFDWHTITYLKIDWIRWRIISTTQNGYIFVWQLTKELLSKSNKDNDADNSVTTDPQQFLIHGEKVHLGSIEGLSLSQDANLVATCSSDCTIQIHRQL
jgi:WD40 repeat protein